MVINFKDFPGSTWLNPDERKRLGTAQGQSLVLLGKNEQLGDIVGMTTAEDIQSAEYTGISLDRLLKLSPDSVIFADETDD